MSDETKDNEQNGNIIDLLQRKGVKDAIIPPVDKENVDGILAFFLMKDGTVSYRYLNVTPHLVAYVMMTAMRLMERHFGEEEEDG